MPTLTPHVTPPARARHPASPPASSPARAPRARVRCRGREAELELLDGHLDALRHGRGGVVVVEGVPGIGRTRLLEEAVGKARRSGLRAVRGAGDPAARPVPFGPLLEALLAGDEPVLDRAALREIAALAEPRFWELEEIQERVAQAALATPTVIAIDDVHWADEATVLALRTMPRRLSTSPVLWLLAVRPRRAAALTTALTAGGGQRIVLGPIGRPAARRLAEDVLGAPPEDAVLDMAGEAAGHPRLLTELLSGLRDEHRVLVRDGRATLRRDGRATPERGHLPRRLRDTVQARLQELTGPARGVVQVASVLGRQFTAQQLAALLDRPLGSLAEPLQEALAADVLAQDEAALRFRHELVREAVAAELPGTMRVGLRRRAVELSLDADAPPTEVAALLLDVAEPGDAKAVAVLRRAAADVAASSPAMAARLSRRALDLTARDDPERAVAVADTIPFLLAAGETEDAQILADTALDGALAPEAEATLRLTLAQLCAQEAGPDMLDQCRRALTLRGLPEELALQARVLLGLGHVLGGDAEALAAAAEADLADATAGGVPATEYAALVNAAAAAHARHDAAATLRLARRADELARERLPAGGGPLDVRSWDPWLAWMSAVAGSPDDALHRADRGVRSCTAAERAPELRAWLGVRCRLLFAAGRIGAARADADAILDLSRELPAGSWATRHARYVLGRWAIHAGDPAALLAAAGAVQDMRAAPSLVSRRTGAWLGALIADAEGQPGRAMSLLGETLDVLGEVTPRFAAPDDPCDLLDLVRIALRAGDRGAAEVAVREAERRARMNPMLREARLVAHHGRGLLAHDAAAVRASVRRLADVPGEVQKAAVLEDAAAVLGRSHPGEVVALLDDALGRYAGAGCERDAARVRRRLRLLGVRRRRAATPSSSGWAELTAAERAVVERVAQGATNREVAAQLFLSRHTVSTHLRHAFEKLGISSRVELARRHAERAG